MAIVIETGTVIAVASVAGAFGAGLAAGFRRTSKILKPLIFLLEDWNGVPGRPGVPGRSGVMERLQAFEQEQARIAAELSTNGGGSLRDEVKRIAAQVASTKGQVDQIVRHMEELSNTRD